MVAILILILKEAMGTRKIKNLLFLVLIKKKYIIVDLKNQINNGCNVIDLCNKPICIKDNFLSNNDSFTCATNPRSFSGFEKDYELNNYEQYFTVEELEVFQIN